MVEELWVDEFVHECYAKFVFICSLSPSLYLGSGLVFAVINMPNGCIYKVEC